MVLILETKEISQAVIGRLPRYYRYLGELEKMGIERVSSHELSSLMHVTASQIRQDSTTSAASASRATDTTSITCTKRSEISWAWTSTMT